MNGIHDHEEAQSLLPWLANGTLAGAELERVHSHLQGCAECRGELAVLHTLRAAGAGDAALGDAAVGDADAALARLLPRLDTPDDADEPDAPPGQAFVSKAPVLQAPVSPIRKMRRAANDSSWLRVAAGVQFCAIVVLGLMLARAPASPGAHADAYRVLGASAGARHGLVVVFHPDTPEREIRRIVLASGARIVGGPTATGAWLLDTEQAPAAALQRLHAEPAVTLTEALDAQGAP